MAEYTKEEIFDAASTSTSVRSIPLNKLKIDKARNVRSEYAYSLENPKFKSLVESMKATGFHEGQHVTVHEEADGTWLMLKGHRRGYASIASGLKEIPAIVLRGLSEQAKMLILVDHGNVEGLDETEELEAVRRLVFAGLGRPSIAKKMNKSTGWVQLRMNLLALPPVIQENWKRTNAASKNTPEPDFKVTWEQVKTLHQSMVADRENGHAEIEEGPKFQEELGKVRGGTNSKKEERQKGYNSTAILGLANSCHSKWLRKMLLVLAGEIQDDMGIIMKTITDGLEIAYPPAPPTLEPAYEGALPPAEPEPVASEPVASEPVASEPEPELVGAGNGKGNRRSR